MKKSTLGIIAVAIIFVISMAIQAAYIKPRPASKYHTDRPACAIKSRTVSAVSPDRSRQLFDAIRHVESNGNDRAVGDGGCSRGPYQIGVAYWTEACRYGGVQWDYLHLVWSRPHCERVMTWYWQKYNAITDEQKVRIHNGGPNGDHIHATLPYWSKVRSHLNKQTSARVGGTRSAAKR